MKVVLVKVLGFSLKQSRLPTLPYKLDILGKIRVPIILPFGKILFSL